MYVLVGLYIQQYSASSIMRRDSYVRILQSGGATVVVIDEVMKENMDKIIAEVNITITLRIRKRKKLTLKHTFRMI